MTVAALAVEHQVLLIRTTGTDWHHVKSMMIEEGHPLIQRSVGIHHIYANDKALEGYRKGLFQTAP